MNAIVVQHIETVWKKRSRGGEGARHRNAVPAALDIPSVSRDHPFILHHATFYEDDSFERRDLLRSADAFAELEVRLLTLTIDDFVLRVCFNRAGGNAAARSPFIRKYPIVLGPGQWGRLVYNGRFTTRNGDWWYQKHVYNIGCFDESTSHVFVQGQPHSEHREMAILR